jgi:hypothetical protein
MSTPKNLPGNYPTTGWFGGNYTLQKFYCREDKNFAVSTQAINKILRDLL